MGSAARRGDDGSLRKGRHDVGDEPAVLELSGGRHRDEALALAALERALDEVHLSAGSGENPGTDGVGADLAGEVNLRCGIDGHHQGIPGDYPGVVCVFDVLHGDRSVVVDEIVDVG